MNRIEVLTQKVNELYQANHPGKADWADWLHENHVFPVAKKSHELARRFGADSELAEAAGMLHDIADAVMKRTDPSHETESMKIARSLLSDSGFSEEEIHVVVDDALQFHSCRSSDLPTTLEGKVMATADAVVHLTTDFYDFARDQILSDTLEDEAKAWALEKLERDYHKKIFFDEVREEVKEDYEKFKSTFAI